MCWQCITCKANTQAATSVAVMAKISIEASGKKDGVQTSDSYSDDLILFSVSVLHSRTFLSNPFTQPRYLSKAWVV